MSRPSHATQQQELEETTSHAPASWRWFLQPDLKYVNAINTSSLRSISGVRMSVALVAAGLIAFGWATWHAVPHCAVEPCAPTVTQTQSADFALGLFNTLCIFVGALVGISVGGFAAKRLTDTEHVERKERAKKAPQIIAPVVTGEHVAQPPVQQTVNVGEDAITAANGQREQAERTEPDLFRDDERG